MNQFYVSIMFLGIILIVVSFLWVILDQKKAFDYSKKLDEKKNNLLNIVNDAEQMVEELNKFSDYIVTQMDLKNEELCSNFKVLEEKIRNVSIKAHECSETKVTQFEKLQTADAVGMYVNNSRQAVLSSSEALAESKSIEGKYAISFNSNRMGLRARDNVIPLNSRHKEVILLAQNGLNDTEIAKKLNMGKGEIELILGINK